MKHVVVLGASSGGIEALRTIAAALPAGFPAPICVVMHIAPDSPGILSDILDRAGPLQAVSPRNGDRLRPATIYVAPPDRHLLIEPGILRVTQGPRENRFRPSIDPLFRSAAQIYGPNAIGVVLTGNLDDGTSGLWTIKQLGGIAVVQDPEDALFPSMPENALRYVKADHIVALRDVAPLLARLTSAAVTTGGAPAVRETVDVEVNIAKEQDPLDAGIERIAEPSKYSCPECHGVLMQVKEGGPIRVRCHTGHAYSIESLLAAVHDGVEEALWESMRALHEGERLMQQMAAHLSETPHSGEQAEALRQRAKGLRARADTIREMLGRGEEVGAAKS